MSTTETWTVGRLLTWTADYLKKQGSASPRLDAEVLLAHAGQCERIELYTTYGDEPDEETKTAFREMVRRRAEGTPVAYLVGYKEFYSEKFEVNQDVLIPRPETEHLIVEALDCAKSLCQDTPDRNLNVADVGTGSGVIGLTIAMQHPGARVHACDLSAKALEVAKRNANNLGLSEDQVQFLESDLLAATEPNLQFDLIVSNPPYISQAEYDALSPTVREHEPEMALLAGPNGDELIKRLLAQAAEKLTADGFLIFEFSPMLAERLDEFIGAPWGPPTITKDLAGHARIVTLQLKS